MPDGQHRTQAVRVELSRLFARAEAMGLVEPLVGTVTVSERAHETITALQSAGIGRARVLALGDADFVSDGNESLAVLEALNADLEASPNPTSEWRRMHSLLGTDLLAALVGVSETSIRRYERLERETPDEAAARLHHVALIVADLAGGYNEFGIRRWFLRKRSALGDRSPAQLLRDDWSPDDPGPESVRQLAARLVGAGAT